MLYGKSLTRARVALSTGVPRRDVDKFVDHPELLASPGSTNLETLAVVLNRWHSDNAFLGPYGVPLELAISKPSGRSFRELVGLVSKDADPEILLDELLRAGVVAKSGDLYVKALSRTYVMPEPLSPEMLEHLGNSLTNLASTLEFNMDPAQPRKRLERAVFPEHGLPPEQVIEFDAFIRGQAHELITRIEDWLANLEPPRQTVAKIAMVQTGLAFFHFIKHPEDEAPLASLVGNDNK
jgi:hypothetical protein